MRSKTGPAPVAYTRLLLALGRHFAGPRGRRVAGPDLRKALANPERGGWGSERGREGVGGREREGGRGGERGGVWKPDPLFPSNDI